jgi:thioredoxin-related protein
MSSRKEGIMRMISMLALATTLAGEIVAQSPTPGRVAWVDGYREARREAKVKNLPILIDVGGPNCTYCRQMDATTLSHPAVVEMINSRFVPLKLDGSRERELVNGLGVRVYPTIIIADPQGQVLASAEGYVSRDKFQNLMAGALAKLVSPEKLEAMFAEASNATGEGEIAKAKQILKRIVAEGDASPVSKRAANLLAELEGRNEPAVAKEEPSPAERPMGGAPGALASRPITREGADGWSAELLGRVLSDRKAGRAVRAHDLAEQIKVLAPGSAIEADAQRVIDDIVRDPELLKQVVEAQSDRLATLLLQAAESCLMQGQPQQAVYFLERVMQAFPTTRHAMTAQTRLAQIQGPPGLSLTPNAQPK